MDFPHLVRARVYEHIEPINRGRYEDPLHELLEEVAQQPASTIVIQPHLLFEGELMEQLRQKVDRWQQLHPHQQWLVPLSLGSGRQLAETFLALAGERLG